MSRALGGRARRLLEFAQTQSAWLRPFAILLALFFFGDLSAAPGRSLLPVYNEDVLGRAPDFASLLVSARLLSAGVAAFVSGALSDALGQRRVVLLGLSGLPVVSLVFLTGSPVALLGLSVYAGFAGGAYYLGADSYTLATVPPHYLGLAAALIFTGPTLGGAAGNSLSGLILEGHGFRVLGLAGAALGTMVFLAGVLFMPDTRGQAHGLNSAQSLSGYGTIIRRPPVLLLGALRFVPTAYWGTA
ncbi:MAG: MFS transporter, partial [Anaerolineae bacterium]|nr:MFS transporter [Anaerolineae bacterium]